MCSFTTSVVKSHGVEKKFRLGMLNQTAGQGLIDNCEGCGENFLHKGIMLTRQS
jgi:hypothetical protein